MGILQRYAVILQLTVHAMALSAQVGDIIDMHAYVGPSAPMPTPTRAAVLGEYGGALSAWCGSSDCPCLSTMRPGEASVHGLPPVLSCDIAGLGLRLEGHLWIPQDSFCYEMQATPHDLEVEVAQSKPSLNAAMKASIADPVICSRHALWQCCYSFCTDAAV